MEEKVLRAKCNECGSEGDESMDGEKCQCGGVFELIEYYEDEWSEREYSPEGNTADQSEEQFDESGHSVDEEKQ